MESTRQRRAGTDARVSSLARSQAGVVTRQQALGCGLTSRQIEGRVARSALLPLLAGVYLSAGSPVSWLTWAWAGVLAGGPGCSLVGASAAAVREWGDQVWPITIAIPATRRVRWRTDKLKAHRLAVSDDEIIRVSGLPITTRLRTAVDIAHLLPIGDAQQLIDRLLVLGLIDLSALTDAVALSSRTGSRQARRLARSAADRAAAESERLAHRILRAAGLVGFTPNYSVLVAGRTVTIDIAFVRARVAIEINGWAFHSAPDRRRGDDAKSAELQLAGWVVLSFGWHDLMQRPEYVVSKIRQALAARSAA